MADSQESALVKACFGYTNAVVKSKAADAAVNAFLANPEYIALTDVRQEAQLALVRAKDAFFAALPK